MSQTLSFQDIADAQVRCHGHIQVTPCAESRPLGELCGCRIYLKRDYLQQTGSFKERGARNALALLSASARSRGVIAASAGNHALGLSYHGRQLAIPVTVVMPRFAPLVKVAACRKLGANVVLQGESFAEARDYATQLALDQKLEYIHGYDDLRIMAGQGTAGLEICQQAPETEAVIIPVGGAGLLAGMALAIKTLRPDVRVIGVESAHAPAYTQAAAAGRPVTVPILPTLADGLAVGRVGEHSFAVARQYADQVVTVSEAHLAKAVVKMMELDHTVIEGSGSAPLAALLSGQLPELRGKHVTLLLSGSNMDLSTLNRIIERGLAAEGRLCQISATISDRPGGLAKLTAVLAASGASVLDVFHDRVFCGPDVSSVRVRCILETLDAEHIQQVRQRLKDAALPAVFDEPHTSGEFQNASH